MTTRKIKMKKENNLQKKVLKYEIKQQEKIKGYNKLTK